MPPVAQPKLLDIIQVGLHKVDDETLAGHSMVEGVLVFMGNRGRDKIATILRPNGSPATIDISNINGIAVVARSVHGSIIKDLRLQTDMIVRLVEYGSRKEVVCESHPPYLPKSDTLARIEEIEGNTVKFVVCESEPNEHRFSVDLADGIPPDSPFTFIDVVDVSEYYVTASMPAEEMEEYAIMEGDDVEITVETLVQVEKKDRVYGDDYQELDLMNNMISKKLETDPRKTEVLVRLLSQMKKSLRIPDGRW